MAEYYHVKVGEWMNTKGEIELNWAGTDADGNPLPTGTKVEVVLQAIPSYYNNVEDVSELNADGMFIRTLFVIDNEKPSIISSETKDNKLKIKMHDNRYTAAVILLNEDADVVGLYAVNQTKAGDDVEMEVDLDKEFSYVALVDYADNNRVYEYDRTIKSIDEESAADMASSASSVVSSDMSDSASTEVSDDATADKSDDAASDSSSDESSEDNSGDLEVAKTSDAKKTADSSSDEATAGIADDVASKETSKEVEAGGNYED